MAANSSATQEARISPLLVNVRDASRLLSISEKTVWSRAKQGILPSVRIGKRRLFSVSALEAWIADQVRS